MKKFIYFLVSVALSAVLLLCSCNIFTGEPGANGTDGRDGRDGKDITVDDIYNRYKEEYGDITFADFLTLYLSYDDTELKEAASLRANVNRSLMSGVSILSRFGYTSYSGGFGSQKKRTTYKIFTGSGVIISLDKAKGDAYVVTNCHVIYDDTSQTTYCEDIHLYLYGQDVNGVNFTIDDNKSIVDDENYCLKDVEIVGASVTYDIALLKVTGSEILKKSDAIAATFATDETVYIGESVYAIGNASSEGMSATYGIISKDSEYIEVGLSDADENDANTYRVLRTTAPVNGGNSGGAMYNTDGKIIAIINAKDESEGIDNMGYALPATCVRRLVGLMQANYADNGNQMISNGTSKGGVKKAFLNIVSQITDSYSRFNSQGLAEITETVKVSEVNKGPAQDILKVGDCILAVKIVASDGTVKEDFAIKRNYNLSEAMLSIRMGDTLKLTIERNGAQMEVSIKFDSESCFQYFE